MERVFSIESGTSGSLNFGSSVRGGALPFFENGVIERVLGPGRFLIVLKSGSKLQVQGASSLKVGDKVQVQSSDYAGKLASPDEILESASVEGGFEWSAFIPLGFGGKNATARLEVFVERKNSKKFFEKKTQAIYFIFTVRTEKQGEIQWSIYLRGRQIAMQVYAQGTTVQKEAVKDIIKTVETTLKTKGFMLMAPIVFLSQPFKIPVGFRLNVRG